MTQILNTGGTNDLSVIQVTQKTVRIDERLVPKIDEAVNDLKDEYGIPEYRSRADLVETAVRKFLKELPKQPQKPRNANGLGGSKT